MKLVFSPRSTVLLGLMALISFKSSLLAQESPTSIAGRTYDTVITGANGPYSTSGSYRWIMSENGTYQAYRISGNVGDETGNYVYQRTAADAGRMSFNDRIRTGYSQLFIYNTVNRGDFYLGNVSFPGQQQGTFKVYSGTGPTRVDRKVFVIQNPTGPLGFGGGGNYRIITTSTNTYVVQNPGGTVERHIGSYTFTRPARSSSILRFDDASYGVGLAILTFENATGTTGSFFARTTNLNHQLATFTVSDLRGPTFLSHPLSRSVTVGQSTTWSISVSGTGPFTYQWYKGSEPIGGANSATYTIPSVQQEDAGTYKVLVSNIADSAFSMGAVLTPVCAYTPSSSRVLVDYKGGAKSVTINATGDCSWSAITTNSWITFTSDATNVEGTAMLNFQIAENLSARARNGFIKVAGKTISVFQGATFAPQDVAGKTFILKSDGSGEGLYNTIGTNVIFFASGTNQFGTVVTPANSDSAVAVEYAFSRISNDAIAIDMGNVDLQFNYLTPRSGTYFGTNFNGVAVVGTFAWTPSTPDFNKDARGDLVWQLGARNLAGWYLRETSYLSLSALNNAVAAPEGWRAVGAGDFNRDGNSDIVFQDSAGRLNAWLMNGKVRISTVPLRSGTAAQGWRAVCVTDLDGNGRSDVLFQAADGRLMGWLFNGLAFTGGFQVRGGLSGGVDWKAIAAGDFNKDGQTDIVVQHTNGQVALWFLNQGALISSELVRGGVTPAGWKLVGAGDLDENGSTDLILLTPKREVAVWLMEGRTFTRNIYLRDRTPVTTGWQFVAPN